jgi:uncharacterized membrane protein YgcG
MSASDANIKLNNSPKKENIMSDFKRPERKKNALDNRKLNLSAPTPGVQGKTASLIWGLYSNNPRITVYTNDPNDQGQDKGYGKISANLDAPTFFGVMGLLHKAVDPATPNEWRDKVENMNFTFFGGKRSAAPAVTSELWVGKDKDGIVWISVTAPNRPKIKFKFGNNDFHHWIHGDGTPFTESEASLLYAKAYVAILQPLMTHLMVTEWVEPEQKQQQGNQRAGGGGGNYGGGNNNNRGGGSYGGGGGGNASQEDDIPF